MDSEKIEANAIEHFAKMFQGIDDQNEFVRRISVFNLIGLLLTIILVEKMSDTNIFNVAMRNFRSGVKSRINIDINHHAEMCNTIIGQMLSSVIEDPEEARVRITTILDECCGSVIQLYNNMRTDIEQDN